MQNCYNISDPAMEDALYEITSMRLFAGLSLEGVITNHKTIMNFRHLLEKHKLGRNVCSYKSITIGSDNAVFAGSISLNEGVKIL